MFEREVSKGKCANTPISERYVVKIDLKVNFSLSSQGHSFQYWPVMYKVLKSLSKSCSAPGSEFDGISDAGPSTGQLLLMRLLMLMYI